MKSSFPPVINRFAKVLVLGSLPGEASLAAQQYYAFKQNAFWRIMAMLFGIEPDQTYLQKIKSLQQYQIALWDVIAHADREGSLDTAINNATLIANDFESLLKKYPGISVICLNGRSVETLFKRHVLRKQQLPSDIVIHVMPSTSPANARLNFEKKLEHWSIIKTFLA